MKVIKSDLMRILSKVCSSKLNNRFGFMLLFTLLVHIGYAQTTQKDDLSKYRFDKEAKGIYRYKYLKMKIPKGYKLLDTGETYYCGDYNFTTKPETTLLNQDSTILISICFEWGFGNPKYDRPLYNHATGILRHLSTAEWRAGKNKSSLVHHSTKYAKKKFNATASGVYVRPCVLPYANKYYNNKTLYIAREDLGSTELTIYYLYTDKAKDIIDKEIEKTAGFIKFLPPIKKEYYQNLGRPKYWRKPPASIWD